MTTTVNPPHPPHPVPPDRPQPRGRYVVLLVLGTLLGLVGLVLASLAAAAGWASVQQRDGGFLTSPTQRYSVSTYALTSAELEVMIDDEVPTEVSQATSMMVRASSADPGEAIFVGIGPKEEVTAYLRSVEHTELTDVAFNPFRPRYRTLPGTRAPQPPGSQTFWAAQASGTGTQTAQTNLQTGTWVVAVMNVDASPGVSADLAAGARTALLRPVTLGLSAGALVLLAGGVALLVLGAAGLGRTAPGSAGGTTASAASPGLTAAVFTTRPYPTRLVGELEPVSRWLWLVKWVLVVPHLLLLAVLWPVLVLTTIVAGFAVLFTGRYPRGLFDFSVGVLRWSWRVGFYAYSALGTDRYPPFTLARTDYPADIEVPYPEHLSRGLVLVKWWLLAIPHLVVVGLLTTPWYLLANGSPADNDRLSISLLGLLVLVAGVALLFTGRYPRPLFDLLMGINRWCYRVSAYVLLLRDEYPPFRLDQGAREPDEAEPQSDQAQ